MSVIKRTIIIGEKKKGSSKKGAVEGATKKVRTSSTIVKSTKREMVREPRVFAADGKVLVIVESPAKSKTIEKFLGKNYVVKASMGHLRDLPSSSMGVNIEEGFEPKYISMPGKKKVIDDLVKEADKASAIYLATDPDREGEAISWHLAHLLNLNETDKNRIAFHEITEHAVQDALKEPRSIDMNMVNAQQARRILDRLVGYELSPLLWKKLCKGLSAGRVQSVAVRLIVEREREIAAFVPEEYWTMEALYSGMDTSGKAVEFPAILTHVKGKKANIPNGDVAAQLESALKGKDGLVEEVEKKKRSRKPSPPFTTSTMQQEAARKLNFGAKKTMMLAQQLYEGKDTGSHGHVGLITYMRTDSTRIAQEMQIAAKDYILSHYGSAYVPSKFHTYASKGNAQDAHEGIRPTSLELSPDVVAGYLSRDELRLYTLIWNRFLASQMAVQQTESLTLTIAVEEYKLKAQGSTVVFPGFTKVYEDDKEKEEVRLPLLAKGEIVHNRSIEGIQHFTQPPPRYSEPSLIKTLEEKGIGRPSTYAPILDTIQSRNYVEKAEKQFIPTELGNAVVDFLVAYFDSIINVDFTADLEKELDVVAEGKETYVELMSKFYDRFEGEMEKAADVPKIKMAEEESGENCPECGSPLVYKFGRFGKFLACSNFPACTFKKAIVHGTGISCPSCHKGEIVVRKSKRGRVFYGCNSWPKCDFSLWNKPIDKFCETCGSIMVVKEYKNGTKKEFCSNAACATNEKQSKKKKKGAE